MNILIIYNKCWSYRVPIFRLLAECCNLTVAYSIGEPPKEEVNFKLIHLPVRQYGRFTIHQDSIRKLANQFDVVLAYGEIGWLSLTALSFGPRKFALAYWNIGLKASYQHRLGDKSFWDDIRSVIFNRADALAIYSPVPLPFYKTKGWDMKKIFVAHNTVQVEKIDIDFERRRDYLFIGTLYKEKGIDRLLEAYRNVRELHGAKTPRLNIVGGGEELDWVKRFVNDNDLGGVVKIWGAIYDESRLAQIFNRSIACISPSQAGLSVLKSMGYGVAFVTQASAVTGGELQNIENGKTGVLYDDPNQLEQIMENVITHPEIYRVMGANAKAYYETERSPQIMAAELLRACEFALHSYNKSV